eukprot:4307321-Amphidinium_carterae.2
MLSSHTVAMSLHVAHQRCTKETRSCATVFPQRVVQTRTFIAGNLAKNDVVAIITGTLKEVLDAEVGVRSTSPRKAPR